jgi:Protein of unknown function (DUF1326)
MSRVWTIALSVLVSAVSVFAASGSKPHGEHWEMAGQLSEACSCSVPCTCNFRQGPSPHHYCWTVFALDIEHGHYGKVQLDGLHLVGAHGKKSQVWYIDQRANPEQVAALKAITLDLQWHPRNPVYWEVARISQRVGDKDHEVEVDGRGGFNANYIIGLDGKTPIVLENNPSWNIQHGIKAKAERLEYHDQHGNKFKFAGVNSNEGHFDWTDQTPKYF